MSGQEAVMHGNNDSKKLNKLSKQQLFDEAHRCEN